MENKKLKINLTTGIYNILMAIASLVAIPAIFIGAFSSEDGASSTSVFLLGAMFIALVLNIISLIKSKKESISITGQILAIIGSALYLILGALLSFPAMVLFIISSVFVLKQSPAK